MARSPSSTPATPPPTAPPAAPAVKRGRPRKGEQRPAPAPKTPSTPRRPMPRPFLKWAGGKGEIVEAILARLPQEMPFYIEPFVGGGAVFFALARAGRVQRALLGDRNPELVEVWCQVRDHVEAVIEGTRAWTPDKASYYAVRALAPTELSAAERAARVLWLNRHCFNGLYRLNSSGQFNVPFGSYDGRPPRIDQDNLRRCSEVLQGVEILQGDYLQVLENVEKNAVVYLDPPYAPVSATANFNQYDGLAFNEADQTRLAAEFAALPSRGVRCAVLSNSDTPLTQALYQDRAGVHVERVMVRRSINRNAAGRQQVSELLARVVSE